MIQFGDFQETGVFGRPHGIKGEINLSIHCELNGSGGDAFLICDMDGVPVPFFIETVRRKSSRSLLVKLENIDSEHAAKQFTGKTAYASPDAVQKITETGHDTFEGYRVIDTGAHFDATVTDFDATSANPLLKVEHNGAEYIIPLALAEHISPEDKTIYLTLPHGFLNI